MNRYSKQIDEKYQAAIKKSKTKVISIWSRVLAIFAILSVTAFFLYDRSELFAFLFIIFLILTGLLFILIVFLLIFFVSEKPLYEILYPKIIEDHNYEEVIPIKYNAYPKDKDFFGFGGLYPSHVSKVMRFKLSFENTHGYHVDVYDAYVATSNGKTSQVHLNGYYLVFRDYSEIKFQLRTHGAPYIRPKYIKLDDIEGVKAYIDANDRKLDIKYVQLYHLIKNEYHSPSVSIGCNGIDLHIGINLSPMKRHVKVLTEDVYHHLRRSLMQMIDLANTIK